MAGQRVVDGITFLTVDAHTWVNMSTGLIEVRRSQTGDGWQFHTKGHFGPILAEFEDAARAGLVYFRHGPDEDPAAVLDETTP